MVILREATTAMYPGGQVASIPFKTPWLGIVSRGGTPSSFYQERNFWRQRGQLQQSFPLQQPLGDTQFIFLRKPVGVDILHTVSLGANPTIFLDLFICIGQIQLK